MVFDHHQPFNRQAYLGDALYLFMKRLHSHSVDLIVSKFLILAFFNGRKHRIRIVSVRLATAKCIDKVVMCIDITIIN